MIAKLTGTIDSIEGNSVILDVNGVGYQLFCSQKTLSAIPTERTSVSLYVETIVREEYIHLYGFLKAEEKAWFKLLMSVQGVGMRAAMSILSVLTPPEISQAIVGQNKTLITRADGVGPKLASRIVNELKDKMTAVPTGTQTNIIAMPSHNDAVSALMNLGYRQFEAAEAISQANNECGEDATLETLIRTGLGKLARSSNS